LSAAIHAIGHAPATRMDQERLAARRAGAAGRSGVTETAGE
jgi:hypothetical protein